MEAASPRRSEAGRLRRPVAAEDLFRFRLLSDARIAPDGQRVVYVVRRTDTEKNRYFSNLWIAGADGSGERAFTRGDHADSAPRWSPDGRWILFVSDREKHPQLWRIPLDGGEAERLTALEEGSIGEVCWSPDGSRIAFTYRPKPPWLRKEAAEERERQHRSTPPMVIRRLRYRTEGEGYLGDERWHLFVLDPASGAVQQLTHADADHTAPAWSPDGREIAFVTNRSEDPDRTPQLQEIRIVPADGGEERPVEAPPGPKGALAWSPDGRWLAYYGHTDVADVWSAQDPALWVVPLDGGEARNLSAPLDRPVGDCTLGDLGAFGSGWTGPVWRPDSSGLYFLVSDRGAVHVCAVEREGGAPQVLTPGFRGEVASLSVDAAGRRLAAVVGDASRPGEVHVAETDGAPLRFRRITAANDALLEELELAEPTEITAPTDGGEVHGWLLRPPGAADGERRPLILYIHGGPHTQYGWALMHEFQFLAARGFAILYSNPRGSRGYGQAHSAAIRGNWGGADFRDLMAILDRACARPDVNPERLAVAGGSYGGYMTNWIVGHTDRFRCALAERSVVNLHSMAGTCDFNFSESAYMGGNVWSGPERLLAQSPLSYADRIRTPLLIIHSEGDLRCPVEQAEQLFAALKRLGRCVEFVRYPREADHGLSRSGPPDLRLDRLQRIAAWMERWLTG